MMGYFDIKKDSLLIHRGTTQFWCSACLQAQPLDDISPDKRYCQSCCDYLIEEAKLLPPNQSPKWKQKTKALKAIPPTTTLKIIMHTVNLPLDNAVALSKRGPRFKNLPVKLIDKWRLSGMGNKEIATRLKNEKGIQVHPTTVSRLLSGQRAML